MNNNKNNFWDNFNEELYKKVKEVRIKNMVNNSKPTIKRDENKIKFFIGLN
jgi:hypothetical protein